MSVATKPRDPIGDHSLTPQNAASVVIRDWAREETVDDVIEIVPSERLLESMSVEAPAGKGAAIADPEAREFLREADPVLARLIDARPDFRPRARLDEPRSETLTRSRR